MKNSLTALGLTAILGVIALPSWSSEDAEVSEQMSRSGFVLENGLAIPAFDPVLGRTLFASKGCVVCHSINGIGGIDAIEFDAIYMQQPMNAFDFSANMWRGASAMIMMQEEELGYQIELSGDELAAIIAFVHNADEQAKFTKDDIPEEIAEIMHGADENEDGEGHDEAEEEAETDDHT